MSYRTLDIWLSAKKQNHEIHEMSLKLPLFELFEEGRQIRRSSKSVGSNIVEGYGRKRYVGDYVRFLTYALASNDETIYHLETLFETKSLTDEELFNRLHRQANSLGKMLNRFISRVDGKD
jgi:four helix bundle protein